MRKQRMPIYTRDTDQREIALVPLANHYQPAKILKDDFIALVDAGYSANWTFNDNGSGLQYVRCKDAKRGNLSSVARLILTPPRNRVIKYRDGNHLNLRRDNLILAPRNTKRAPSVKAA